MALLGGTICTSLPLLNNVTLFSKWSYRFSRPPAVYESSCCFTSLTAPYLVSDFNFFAIIITVFCSPHSQVMSCLSFLWENRTIRIDLPQFPSLLLPAYLHQCPVLCLFSYYYGRTVCALGCGNHPTCALDLILYYLLKDIAPLIPSSFFCIIISPLSTG